MLSEMTKREFLEGDPVIRFVLYKLRLAYWVVPALLMVRAFFVFILLAAFLGTLRSIYDPSTNIKLTTGTLDQPGQLIIAFLVQPLFIGYYLFFNQIIWSALEGLAKSGVVPKSRMKEYEVQVKGIAQNFSNRWLFLCGLAMAAGASISITGVAINLFEGPFWLHQQLSLFTLLELPVTFFTTYSVSMICLRIIIFQLGLSKIYRKVPTELHLLHIDGAGGYAPIGKAVGTYLICVLAGLGFYIASGISYIGNSVNHEIPEYLIVQFFCLPIFAAVAFFWPLLSTREEMRRAIRRNLSKYRMKFDQLEKRLSALQKAGSNKALLSDLDGIIEITNKISRSSPSWPFNTQVFNGFLATLGTSALPFAISMIEKYLLPVFLS